MSMLEVFKDAASLLLNIAERSVRNIIEYQSETIRYLSMLLDDMRKRGKMAHTVGMGRSGLAGKFFADLLKMHGIRASVIGDILAKPVNPGDVVFAFSGSGWTKTTTLYAELSIQRGATLVAFTATRKSKLDRLADVSIYLPGKPILDTLDYMARKISGKYKSPLAPMGSVNEFASLLYGIGLVSTIKCDDDPVECFRNTIMIIIDACRKSIDNLLKDENKLEKIINTYVNAKENKKICFFSGLGLLEHICWMIAIRFQHLGLLVSGISDWIIRRPDDILTVMSGSGEAPIPKILAEEAKKTGMTIIGVVGNRDSTIAKLSDIYLELSDVGDRKKFFAIDVNKVNMFIPAFEIAVLIIFESIVAEIANRFGLTEETMRSYHANIE
ncbi:MAG: SIS domain-containing protein [Candidatus Njordarchaeota archaeon]